MAPDITTTLTMDIRVPPISLTDPAILDNFPELFYSKPGRLATYSRISRDSPDNGGEKWTAIPGQESITTLNTDTRLLLDETYSEEAPEDSPVYDDGDLFDSEYVLPDNCQWWQQVGDLSFEASPGDFDVVDLPHFGDDLNYSSLWEDVDTFVSVVDVTNDDGTEERAVHEPVYCLDTRRTTVWGLDIIWEDEEHNCEI